MRRPSPALVVASIALFVALGGAGFAASLALSPVRSPKPVVLVPGSVSANGKVTGTRMTGGRASLGVYTITISGGTFASNKTFKQIESMVGVHASSNGKVIDPTCDTSGGTVGSNGSATVEVDCFTYDLASGRQPTDAAFDIQVIGPSR